MAASQEPVWIDAVLALAIHDRQLAEHGGPIGLRDASALESALARPRNQWTYGETDMCALAAAYAFGVSRNHPFIDGNKRTAWVLARLFLALNDMAISFQPTDAIKMVVLWRQGSWEKVTSENGSENEGNRSSGDKGLDGRCRRQSGRSR